MTWWVLVFVLYVNGQPTLQTEVFLEDYSACQERRIEVSRMAEVGKAGCWVISE